MLHGGATAAAIETSVGCAREVSRELVIVKHEAMRILRAPLFGRLDWVGRFAVTVQPIILQRALTEFHLIVGLHEAARDVFNY